MLHMALTEEGVALMAELLPVAAAFQERLEARLGPDFAAFERVVQRILDGEAPGPGAPRHDTRQTADDGGAAPGGPCGKLSDLQ